MVDSKELNTASLINAMEKGDFYASTGVYLKSIKKTSKELTIEIDEENGVNYELIFLGYKEGSEMVKELKRVNGAKANYVFQEEDIFVRVKVISNEPKDSPDGTNELKQAWVQPILIKG